MAPAFRRALLGWYAASKRDLPWRRSNAFYPVWLSEIMLQQTRVEAVIPYYLRFLERFPSMEALAAAPEADVLAAWSGLGYYSRARNLHRAARRLAAGALPATYEQVLDLPGAGPYTAAAIASIALGLPHAAVDGNVTRVVSRLTNDASEMASPAARRRIAEAAGALLDTRRPGDFNQAMMELGATICLPRTPECGRCPVEKFCAARAAGTEKELPVKLKKQKARDARMDLVLLEDEQRVVLIRRPSSARRLADFWELPEKKLFPGIRCRKLREFRHQIVNDRFRVAVWTLRAATLPSEGRWFSLAELDTIPVTTVTRKALEARVSATRIPTGAGR
jgi:A/G-specific adenine glycosylase